MQISRSFLIACVTTSFLSPSLVISADNAAQIKARQALEQQLQGSQPAAAAASPAAAAPARTTTATPSQPEISIPPALNAPRASSPEQIERAREALRNSIGAPATPPAAPAVPPMRVAAPPAQPAPSVIAAPQGANPEAIEKARQALRQNLGSTPAPVTVTPPPAAVQAPTVTVMPPPTIPPADTAAVEKARTALRQDFSAIPQTNPEAAEKAQQALHRSFNEVSQPGVARPMTGAAADQMPAADFQPIPAPADAGTVDKAVGALHQEFRANPPARVLAPGEFEPIKAPPTGLAPQKQQQLDQLLEKYKADQLTPEEYHRERARILSQP